MQSFNPFLRSFFSSKLPSQCSPSSHFVLLVPSAEFILTQTELDSQLPYLDLVQNEDFLASHVIRVPGGLTPIPGSQWPNSRESKVKTKQYTTLNGRTLVIKDNFVYSNKGFKNLSQAQLLHDELYQADTPDLSQWLIYHISRAIPGVVDAPAKMSKGARPDSQPSSSADGPHTVINKRIIASFDELLDGFPMIERTVQPALERLCRDFVAVPEQSNAAGATGILGTSEEAIATSETSATAHSATTRAPELRTAMTTASASRGSQSAQLRERLETLVLSAIDIFQSVDKAHLSHLGETTDLSGTAIEKMIERFIAEQVHDQILFSQVRTSTRPEDEALDGYLKKMGNVDVSQVGLSDFVGYKGKQNLLRRILDATTKFRRLEAAVSPQEMLDVLMDTQQCLSSSETGASPACAGSTSGEKSTSGVTVNADILVSLLLMVVIRSPVRELHARLAYMRDFNLFTDVDNGQTGYALSTFEGVLGYLSGNPKGLIRVSKMNKRLWQAVRKGNLATVQSILEPSRIEDGDVPGDTDLVVDSSESDNGCDLNGTCSRISISESRSGSSHEADRPLARLTAVNLSHVSPLEQQEHSSTQDYQPRIKKRVSMETRSLSNSSVRSSCSGFSTVASIKSLINDETSPDQLIQTQDDRGNTILFMAIERMQVDTLKYLLQLETVVTPGLVMEYQTDDGTTLLSAAVQASNVSLVDMVLNYVLEHATGDQLSSYLACQDSSGRSVAHYCFSAPSLLFSMGHLFPWRQKDKNGQTPLFAICRCYDHPDYHDLAGSAIAAATRYQGDGQPLELADHADGKGNTLLHIVNDNVLILELLQQCSTDINAANQRRFTPLMVASKFARLDLMRLFFTDPRMDLQARDLRGLTAVEVAKDDAIRNQIDDLVLLCCSHSETYQRRTTIVRALLVDDGSIRMVIKSGAPGSTSRVTITTCRRSLADFETLCQLLSLEQPASWIPSIANLRSPFQITPRPSKQVLRDIQLRLDGFLQAMLSHPTFGTHEMLWEFFLVPDIDARLLAERTRRKAETRVENLVLDFSPLESLTETEELEVFIGHAIGQVRQIHTTLKAVARRVIAFRNVSSDVAESHLFAARRLAEAVTFVPNAHLKAVGDYAATLTQTEYSPPTRLQYQLLGSLCTTTALLKSLGRPNSLIGAMAVQRTSVAKHTATLRRARAWPSAIAGLGLLESQQRDAEAKAARARSEMQALGRELRYTQTTVAGELAAWQDGHAKEVRDALREWALRMRDVERARLVAMQRARRGIVASGAPVE